MSQLLQSALLLLAGFIPSAIWLRFFFVKDRHPEPIYLISRVFLAAIILAPLAILCQWLFIEVIKQANPAFHASESPQFFLWAALVEEFIKFLPFVIIVFYNNEFDEPVDAMIYMIAAGLGFAAIENILVVAKTFQQGIHITFQLLVLRFIGATLLHAVASGLIGYFIGLAWFYHHHSKKIILVGIIIATLLHFAFNMLLVVSEIYPFLILGTSGLLVIITYLVSILFYKIQERQDRQLSTTLTSSDALKRT